MLYTDQSVNSGGYHVLSAYVFLPQGKSFHLSPDSGAVLTIDFKSKHPQPRLVLLLHFLYGQLFRKSLHGNLAGLHIASKGLLS